ncbi:MAG: hypothetical protein V3S07_08145 [Micropepsaceae bacterium]
MRFTFDFAFGAVVAGIALAFSFAPAHAAWEYYISHPLSFSVVMPSEVTASRGTYEAIVAGTQDTIVFSSSENGIDYRVTLVDMREIQNNAATLLGEAAYNFQDGNNLMMDIDARVDRHYGRKLTVELPDDAGRATAEYFVINGRLIELRATIAPGGDYGSPNIARFIDSLAFFPDMANQNSIELTLPE